MDQSEFESTLSKLEFAQEMRNFDYETGIVFDKSDDEKTDTYETIELMGEAYEILSEGIHQNVQAWSKGEGNLLHRVEKPYSWINGEVAASRTEFLLGPYGLYSDEQPEYIEKYTKARDSVFSHLLESAKKTNDFDPLLGIITTYKESDMAKMLINELYARKERYPDMIAGDAELVLSRIDMQNKHIDDVKKSAGIYAITNARREFFYQAREELNEPETGILKAIALGLNIKFGQPKNKNKWRKTILEEPLTKVMRLPSVPEQLLAREKEGIPLEIE